MNLFNQRLSLIKSLLTINNHEIDYDYQIFCLKEEDQARIFRQPKAQYSHTVSKLAPATTGRFVALVLNPKTQNLVLRFMEFPKGEGESFSVAALDYSLQEMTKPHQHILSYLALGTIPKADGEYAA